MIEQAAGNDTNEFNESRLPYKVRVDREMYAALVEPANIKSTLSLHPETIVNQAVSVKSEDLNGYRYEVNLGAGQLVNNYIDEVFDLTLRITSKTYADGQVYNGVLTTTAAKTAGGVGYIKLPCGQSRVFAAGASALKSNPIDMITSSVTVAVGKTKTQFQTNLSPSYVDAQLRMVDEKELIEKYNYAPLKPDDVKSYHDVCGYSYYSPDDQYTRSLIGNVVGAVATDGVKLIAAGTGAASRAYGAKAYEYPEGAAAHELAVNRDNVLGCVDGGRGSFSYTSKFYKGSAPTVELAKRTVNGIEMPSDDAGATVWYSGAGDTLIEVITFTGLRTPINNVIFKQFAGSERALHNINLFSVERRYQSNHKVILASCISQSLQPSYGCSTAAQTEASEFFATAQLAMSLIDASVSVTISNQNIWIKTITLPNLLRPSPVCTIPYCKQSVFDKTRTGIAWSPTNAITFSSDNQIIGKIPEYLMLWVEDYDYTSEFFNVSPASRAKINQLSIQLGNNHNTCVSYSQEQLYRMTKENGFVNYDWNTHIRGRKLVVPNNNQIKTPYTTGAGAVANTLQAGWQYVAQTPTAANATLRPYLKELPPVGTIVCLRYGKDIPLNNENLSNAVTCAINFTVTVQATSTSTSTVGTLRCMNFTYERAYIDASGDCRDLDQSFTPADVLGGFKIINAKQDAGSLTVNDRVITGGSWMSGLKNKLNEFMPKVLPAVRKAREQAMSVSNKIDKGNRSARRGLELLSQLGV